MCEVEPHRGTEPSGGRAWSPPAALDLKPPLSALPPLPPAMDSAPPNAQEGDHAAPYDVWIKQEPCEEAPPSPLLRPRAFYSDPSTLVSAELGPPSPSRPARVSRPYGCPTCGRGFSSRALLAQHERRHDMRTYQCDVCKKTFTFKANLIRHQKRSCELKPPQSLTCTVCHKVFARAFLLKSHLRRHQDDKPYQCEVCQMFFKHKSTVERHKLIHFDHKPYSCHVCGKGFTSPALMKPHLRTHTKEKPFQCPICLKMFSQKHNMQRHALRHNKVKHLVCDVCNKKFPKESRLKYHMRVHWEDKKPFKCKQCHKSYSHKQNIIRHYKRKHPDVEYIPPDTDAGLATKAWQRIIEKKALERIDCILPEVEPDVEEEILVRPELILVESDWDRSSDSGTEGSHSE